jgi:Xaa-Pro dipeptidase
MAREKGRAVALHFEVSEFDARVAHAREALGREKLDAILLFAQESLYYLTGFDTSGFVFFQCAVLTAGSDPIVLLTRRPDLEQARRTSTITDVRLWYDREGADPSVELKAILEEKKLGQARIGIELRTFGHPQARCSDRAIAPCWCAVRRGSGISTPSIS